MKLTDRGLYIVIEGQDGSGKNTQVDKLAEYFMDQGRKVVTVYEGDRDNSGLKSTTEIYKTIKNRDYQIEPISFLLYFTASRIELWKKVIEPNLVAGNIVISSRNWWSTLAFQGYGFGIDLSQIESMTRQFMPARYVEPDFGIILSTDQKTAASRVESRNETYSDDVFESQADDFQQRVNDGYLKISSDKKIKIINASGNISDIHKQILSHINTK